MENNIKNKNLSSFGFNNYYITPKGTVINTTNNTEVQKDKLNRFVLVDNCGKAKRITQKQIYRKVFKTEFSVDTIENLKGEEWQPIDNTKGKYYVSNCGRIKSYCGYSAIILKPYLHNKGYLEVKINNKNVKIHQLVAKAFCENRYKNTDTKTEIHHINRNKQDNRAENLIILSIEEHHKAHTTKGVVVNG